MKKLLSRIIQSLHLTRHFLSGASRRIFVLGAFAVLALIVAGWMLVQHFVTPQIAMP